MPFRKLFDAREADSRQTEDDMKVLAVRVRTNAAFDPRGPIVPSPRRQRPMPVCSAPKIWAAPGGLSRSSRPWSVRGRGWRRAESAAHSAWATQVQKARPMTHRPGLSFMASRSKLCLSARLPARLFGRRPTMSRRMVQSRVTNAPGISSTPPTTAACNRTVVRLRAPGRSS